MEGQAGEVGLETCPHAGFPRPEWQGCPGHANNDNAIAATRLLSDTHLGQTPLMLRVACGVFQPRNADETNE